MTSKSFNSLVFNVSSINVVLSNTLLFLLKNWADRRKKPNGANLHSGEDSHSFQSSVVWPPPSGSISSPQKPCLVEAEEGYHIAQTARLIYKGKPPRDYSPEVFAIMSTLRASRDTLRNMYLLIQFQKSFLGTCKSGSPLSEMYLYFTEAPNRLYIYGSNFLSVSF